MQVFNIIIIKIGDDLKMKRNGNDVGLSQNLA